MLAQSRPVAAATSVIDCAVIAKDCVPAALREPLSVPIRPPSAASAAHKFHSRASEAAGSFNNCFIDDVSLVRLRIEREGYILPLEGRRGGTAKKKKKKNEKKYNKANITDHLYAVLNCRAAGDQFYCFLCFLLSGKEKLTDLNDCSAKPGWLHSPPGGGKKLDSD